jgi:hypothetical protein
MGEGHQEVGGSLASLPTFAAAPSPIREQTRPLVARHPHRWLFIAPISFACSSSSTSRPPCPCASGGAGQVV